ncbi:MAG: hypothetical protein IGR76_11865 [Synechococcales cyanobacterium T60_A2020_003]|nr:hypothetical protein [Synechococcales cyanobacterium T60_A2020_003]
MALRFLSMMQSATDQGERLAAPGKTPAALQSKTPSHEKDSNRQRSLP